MNAPDDDLRVLADIAREKLGWQGPLARDLPLVEGLALDSLKRLTLVIEVEDRFRICLDETDETAIGTVGDLLDTIRRKRGERGADPR
jgi:acyl carrier protein